jgi:hypothetical protein
LPLPLPEKISETNPVFVPAAEVQISRALSGAQLQPYILGVSLSQFLHDFPIKHFCYTFIIVKNTATNKI